MTPDASGTRSRRSLAGSAAHAPVRAGQVGRLAGCRKTAFCGSLQTVPGGTDAAVYKRCQDGIAVFQSLHD